MLPISMPAPLAQYPVVILTPDPCTPVQYDGLVVTQKKQIVPGKGKAKAVFLSDKSNYGESSLEQEEQKEEEEMVADCF